MTNPAQVRLEGISKSFSGTNVLNNVSLEISQGKVRALLGQNGSGKSTLIKILSGVYSADAGRLWLWDRYESLPLKSMLDAGIAVIHQDLGLVRNQTALENFCIGSREWNSLLRPIRWGQERERFNTYCERFGFASLGSRATSQITELRPGERTAVAVMRAMRQLDDSIDDRDRAPGSGVARPRALILDEPTVFFGEHERRLLSQLLQGLLDDGVGVLIVTHDFHDVFDFGHTVTVLRDGHVVMDGSVSTTSEEELVQSIMGRAIERAHVAKDWTPSDEIALRFEDVSTRLIRNVNIEVRRGEILGVTGLAGMGHEELPYLASGLRRAGRGRVVVGTNSGVEDVRGQGAGRVGLVPGDRASNGLWLDGSIRENLSLGRIQEFTRRGILRIKLERAAARGLIERYGIVAHSSEQHVWTLSGGNQQRVLVGRVLSDNVVALALDEPIQGVDVGAGLQIAGLLMDAARAGIGILVSSSDHDLLVRICDRVAIVRQGEITTVLAGAELSPESIIAESQGKSSQQADSMSSVK